MNTVNNLPSRKYRKCLMASAIANNSRSNVEYLCSVGVIVLEKNAKGTQCWPCFWCNTAPTATLDASVVKVRGASRWGCAKRVAFSIGIIII